MDSREVTPGRIIEAVNVCGRHIVVEVNVLGEGEVLIFKNEQTHSSYFWK